MEKFWQGKRVFITGHTGFKGGWLSLWLQSLGAEVIGYSLKPPSFPALFDVAHIANGMISIEGDISDFAKLQYSLQEHKPEIIFHMAAQSLVRCSYQFPLETLATNIMGTANILEAARHADSVRVIVNITSDKCYENREWVWGYRENDAMGGHDPYSCSKGCAELVTASYRRSYFSLENTANIASARAGNAIGGGDWAADRLVPDGVRAIVNGEPILIRNPRAIRPWQHVLEPLSGYLLLAHRLWDDDQNYEQGWNFGPDEQHAWTVEQLTDMFCRLWGDEAKWFVKANDHLHEAHYLKLDSSKAMRCLGWRPVLDMKETLAMTVEWYKRFYDGEDPRELTLAQIAKYQTLGKENRDV